MIKKIALFALTLAIIAAVLFTSCSPARRPYDNTTGDRTGYPGDNNDYSSLNYTGAGANPGTTGYSIGNDVGYGTDFGTPGTGMGTNVGNTSADRIEEAVSGIPGVQTATAVVRGNTVYVGVTLVNATRNPANTADLERRIKQIVKKLEPGARTVHVSTGNNDINRMRTAD